MACRLGIAAYGLAAKAIGPLSWLAGVLGEDVDEAPFREHARRRRRDQDVADEADRFAAMSQLRKTAKRS